MKRIILSFCCLAGFLLGYSQGTVQYAKWKNNATGAYSFDTDDYNCNYYADMNFISKIIDSLGLKITFSMQQSQFGFLNTYGILNANTKFVGCEFANHSWDHDPVGPAKYYLEVDSAQKRMDELIPWQKCLTFTFPGGVTYDQDMLNAYIRTKRYIGSGRGGFGNPNPWNISDPFKYSVPYWNDPMTLSQLNGVVDQSISSGNWGIWGTHNIGVLTSVGPIAADIFRDHMIYCRQKIDAGQLWMAPIQNVVKYIMERQKFPISIVTENDTMMVVHFDTQTNEINPSAMVDNTLYDEPLTLTGTTKFGTNFQLDANPWWGDVVIKYNASSVLKVTQGKGMIFPAPGLTIDKTYEEVVSAGSNITVTVNSSPKAFITSHSSWIKISKDSITGNSTVTVTVEKSMTPNDRYGYVSFTNNGQDIKKLVIKQAKDNNLLDFLLSTLTVKYNAVTASLTLASNLSWQVTSSASWITPNTTSGSNTTSLKFTVIPNPDTIARTAWIKASNVGGYKDSTLVTQEAKPKDVVIPPGNLDSWSPLINIYPNPVVNELMVEDGSSLIARIDIINLQGSIVKSLLQVDFSAPINVTEIPGGAYIIKITLINGEVINKMVIKK